MKFQCLAVLAAATASYAITPAGFQPGSTTQLFVTFNSNIAALNGAVVSKDTSAVEPALGTAQKLPGLYMAIMVDLDIPQTPPTTLLHWMSGHLRSAATPTMMNMSVGTQMMFMLEKVTAGPDAMADPAAYIGPNPPARNPLSHRYTQILVDVTNLPDAGMTSLMTAAMTRLGFNPATVLGQAGLANKVVAGNFFNVTNAGPAMTGSGGMFGNGTTPSTGTPVPPARPTGSVIAGGVSLLGHASGVLMGLVAVASLFLAL